MTTDESAVEKQLEKITFDLLKDNDLVQKDTKRLEVLVVRTGDGETKVNIYGQLQNGIVDTAILELELTDGWQKEDLNNIGESLANKFIDTLEDMSDLSSFDDLEDEEIEEAKIEYLDDDDDE